VALLLEPFADAQLILCGTEKLGDLYTIFCQSQCLSHVCVINSIDGVW
jgi:hypothetical protein